MPDEYYIISFRLSPTHYQYSIGHIGLDTKEMPFSMLLLETNNMEYSYNQNFGENGSAASRVSKVKYLDTEGRLLFVKKLFSEPGDR